MTVVTIIGVIAAVAITSMRKTHSEGDSDAWANTVRNVMVQARRRAVATGNPYMVELTSNSIEWCQFDPVACKNAATFSCATPPANGNFEIGKVVYAGADAMTDSYATTADAALVANQYSTATHVSLPAGTLARVFFGHRGIVDALDCNNVLGSSLIGSGFTAYVRASNAVTVANPSPYAISMAEKHRRVVVLGTTGRPSVTDYW
jgi:hypothetical protein